MEFHSPCLMGVSFVRFLLYCSSIVRFTGTVVINMTYHLCTFRSKLYLISVLDLWFHWCYCFLYVLSPVYCFTLNYSWPLTRLTLWYGIWWTISPIYLHLYHFCLLSHLSYFQLIGEINVHFILFWSVVKDYEKTMCRKGQFLYKWPIICDY